jgi:uncharacterized membrane protein
MNQLGALVTLVTALGCAAIGGAFFAFSSLVMPALARLPPAAAISAMQAINVVALTRWFLGAFLGTAAACALLALLALFRWSEPGARLCLAGSLLYLTGGLLLTRALHVPRNEALSALVPDGVEAAAAWARFLDVWTRWNHVRAAASVAAAALLTLALSQSTRVAQLPP